MADTRITTPSTSTGIIRFYDVATGGPTLDPKAVVVISIAFIALIKIVSMIVS